MKFNLNNFLNSISFVLDYAEQDLLKDITNHSRRVSYIAVNLGKQLNLSKEELFDLGALAILHDCGAGGGNYKDSVKYIKKHCEIGEEIVKKFPFFTDVNGAILYHHEFLDGSGPFSKKYNEIPIFAQIISLANTIEVLFVNITKDKSEIVSSIKKMSRKKFDQKLIDAFIEAQKQVKFWIDLQDIFIFSSLNNLIPSFYIEVSYKELHNITKIFSNIVDSKSRFTLEHSNGLADKCFRMCSFYGCETDKKYKLMIAADLHDIGKLAISNRIIDKNGDLTSEEFLEIKSHSYLTRKALEKVDGFEEIVEWASNHHEKLNGKGYPLALKSEDLDFNSRLLGCLDIYQALTEDRPYRKSLGHEKSIEIMNKMVSDGLIDEKIVNEINSVFSDN